MVTITEVKECRRCGETRVVSENKEVTAVESRVAAPDDTPTEPTETAGTGVDVGADPGPTETGAADTAVAADADADGAVAGDDDFDHPAADVPEEGRSPASRRTPRSSAGRTRPPRGIPEATAADADADAGGRGHGEWPDADANRKGDESAAAAEPGPWPDDGTASAADADTDADAAHSPAEGEAEDVEFIGDDDPSPEDRAANEARTDVVPDADRADEAGAAGGDDAEFIDGEGPGAWPEQRGDDEGYDAEVGGDDGSVSVDGNLTPRVDGDAAADEGDGVEFIEADPSAGRPAPAADNGSTAEPAGEADGASRPQVELTTTADRIETVYVCPDCGNREPVGASSMRAGDICPDCKRGYIEERELQ
ncbi:hypothetical protein ACFQRB_06330 [Halobaculum litoreum]|uniref:Oxidoreductase n=1 Tax=Halobaculum litoreum TaxID=3031998 RepID=A0ABD5XMD4_9EURY